MTVNLVEHCLFRHADDPVRAQKTALIFTRHDGPDEIWTYQDVADAVRRFARGLRAIGLDVGDRLVIRLDTSSEFAIAFFGAVAAGLIPVPTSPQLTHEEVEFLLVDSGARAVVAAPSLVEGIDFAKTDIEHLIVLGNPKEIVEVRADIHLYQHLRRHDGERNLPAVGGADPAYLIYTSGTTRHPKGVLHAHRSALGRAIVIREWEGLTSEDRVCHAGALNWTYTLGVGLMDPWSVGATSILYAGPRRPQVWLPLLERTQATIFAAVPTVFRQVLKYVRAQDYRLPSLRHVLTAGEPLLPETYLEWRRRFGVEMYEALGMSEISTFVSFKPGMRVRPGACGVPQEGRPIRLVRLDSLEDAPPGETGRIVVHQSDPGLMLRYWNRSEEQQGAFEGEWFVGGDTAAADADGIWWFKGRCDDVMSSFGYRVSPQEVESVVSLHPEVAECAVAMLPTGEAGVELLTAFVRLKDGCVLDEASLEEHCREHLAEYKRPKAFRSVNEFPRTANGKVLRRELRLY